MDMNTKTIENDLEYLRQRSEEVDFSDKSYLNEIEKLKEYCNREDSNTLALAAVQVGILKRMIYIRNTNVNDLLNKEIDEARVIINPVIIERIGHTKYWEACASCLNKMGLVNRPYQIKVKYYDELGKEKTEKFIGFEATVFSHEFDHINGVLHIDKSEQILDMEPKEREEFRKIHPYEIIAKDGKFIEEGEKNERE